jgi:DNA-binding transcriptional regulator YdaS (Cro superfamily)
MTDPSQDYVSLHPIITALAPYVVAAFGAIITASAAWAAAAIKRRTGIEISQHDLDVFDKAAKAQAGKIVAQETAGWEKKSFDVKNPIVADAVSTVLARLPAEANRIGVTPAKVGDMIVGEIGHLQASATSTPLIPPITAATTQPRNA